MTEEKKSIRHKVCEEALIVAAEEIYTIDVINPGIEDVIIGEGSGFDFKSKEEWMEDLIARWLEEAATRLGV